jgi:predicted GNAT family acetyltransferase
MRVTRHTDPDAFIAAAAPMAARGEASASFFAGWAHAMKRSPPEPGRRVYLATCGDCGAAIQRDDGPVIVGQSEPAAAIAFAEDLATDWPALQGVVGSPAASDAFAGAWRERTGRAHVQRIRMRQHGLRAVADVPAAPGIARVATEGDVPWLVEAQIAFIAEAGIPDTAERVRRDLPERIARGDFRVWDDAGAAAYAGFNDAAPDFARIAPVYTLPERRRRGYATALVAALARELLGRGKRRLFLTTDTANPTSNAIYARIGFVPESEDVHLDFVDVAA